MLTETIQLYENRTDVTLTSYILDDSSELYTGKKRPTVLICPGGGYLYCSDREDEPIALKFASMGYHAVVLRYSVYVKPGETLEELTEHGIKRRNHSIFPNAIREIGMVMRILHNRSDEWRIDTENIILCGFSAGAHNVATYSVYWNKPVLTDYFSGENNMLKPAATILGYALSDYLYMDELSMNEDDRTFFETSVMALLGTTEPDNETLKKVSPALLVNKDTPPMFLWATANDELVPVGHTTRMATALADHNIPFEMHIFEEGIHGLSLSTHATARTKEDINSDAANWVPLVEKWMEKRFTLEL